MTHAGYITTPELRDELLSLLCEHDIPHVVVYDPVPLGDEIRPVLIIKGPKPRGTERWARYRKCKNGDHGYGLDQDGTITYPCGVCAANVDHPTAEELWERLENHSLVDELALPGWMNQHDVGSVAELREALRQGTLANVGPERTAEVAIALEDWRNKVRERMWSE